MTDEADTYKLEVFVKSAWTDLPGYAGMDPATANFFSGYLNRSSNTLARLVRERDGEVFCGRVRE